MALGLAALARPTCAEEASLYEVLGVAKNASEQEVKKASKSLFSAALSSAFQAYKRAAVKFHPDKARMEKEKRFCARGAGG